MRGKTNLPNRKRPHDDGTSPTTWPIWSAQRPSATRWDPQRADKEELDTATVASYLINNNTLISTQQSISATSSEDHIVRAGLGNIACSGDNVSGAKTLFGGTGSVLADVGRGGGGGN